MKSYWAFFPFCTFAWGMNTGFTYLITIHHSWLWFPNNPGLASGICMGGYGIGALLFDNIMTPVINPQNLNFIFPCPLVPNANFGCYPESVDMNFKKMMYILIGIFAGLIIIGMVSIW